MEKGSIHLAFLGKEATTSWFLQMKGSLHVAITFVILKDFISTL